MRELNTKQACMLAFIVSDKVCIVTIITSDVSAKFRLGEALSYIKLGGPLLKITPEGLTRVHNKTGPWVTTKN